MRSEFDNVWVDHCDTVDHLYKVQIARCNELFIYLEILHTRYGSELAFGLSWWSGFKHRTYDSMSESTKWLKKKFGLDQRIPLTETEQKKYFIKLQRVLDAKYDFELFRGEYKNYQ